MPKLPSSRQECFIEKTDGPPRTGSGEAEELVSMAERKNRVLMVGHTFPLLAGRARMKESSTPGHRQVQYVGAAANLGLFQKDINVAWDLAPP